LKRVEDYNLFQHDIVTLNINYPGSVTVKAKEILDVPESALNKNYLNDVINLYNLIRNMAKGKHIRGNVLGTKILSLSLDPLTKSINKERKVSTIKMYIFLYFQLGRRHRNPFSGILQLLHHQVQRGTPKRVRR
jgi:hypothetical protein